MQIFFLPSNMKRNGSKLASSELIQSCCQKFEWLDSNSCHADIQTFNDFFSNLLPSSYSIKNKDCKLLYNFDCYTIHNHILNQRTKR